MPQSLSTLDRRLGPSHDTTNLEAQIDNRLFQTYGRAFDGQPLIRPRQRVDPSVVGDRSFDGPFDGSQPSTQFGAVGDQQTRTNDAPETTSHIVRVDDIPTIPNGVPDTPFNIDKFLSELPHVAPEDLPTDQEDACLICGIKHGDEDPGTGYHEYPVKLPCGRKSLLCPQVSLVLKWSGLRILL